MANFDNDTFVIHGTYSEGLHGYEIELSKDCDQARLRSFDLNGNEEITDWLDIEQVWPDEYEEPAEGEQDLSAENVIDPNGYNIPLSEVIRHGKF